MSDRRVLLYGPSGSPIQEKANDADALAVAGSQILAASLAHASNGNTWDRIRAGVNAIGSALTGHLNVILEAIRPSVGTAYAFRTAEADSTTDFALPGIVMYAYNGTHCDRWRNNVEATLLASATRNSSTSSPVQTNYNGRGVLLFLRVTAASGTGGLQVVLDGIDPVSGAWAEMHARPAAVTATGVYVYEYYPGASSSAGGHVVARTAACLPRRWAATVFHGDNSDYTYSLGACVIL